MTAGQQPTTDAVEGVEKPFCGVAAAVCRLGKQNQGRRRSEVGREKYPGIDRCASLSVSSSASIPRE